MFFLLGLFISLGRTASAPKPNESFGRPTGDRSVSRVKSKIALPTKTDSRLEEGGLVPNSGRGIRVRSGESGKKMGSVRRPSDSSERAYSSSVRFRGATVLGQKTTGTRLRGRERGKNSGGSLSIEQRYHGGAKISGALQAEQSVSAAWITRLGLKDPPESQGWATNLESRLVSPRGSDRNTVEVRASRGGSKRTGG